MLRPSLERLLCLAICAALAAGCTGREDARGPVRGPPAAVSSPPAVTALPAPPAKAEEPAPSPPAAAPAAPSEAELTAALAAIQADPAPDKITLDTHYVVSNEDKPQSFYEAIAGRGGAYVGVGAEQSFLLGGWARAEVMFLMDFDQWVVDINEVHGLVLQHARTPEEVVELWGPEHAAEIKGWINESTSDRAVAEHRAKVYDQGRPKVEYRLKWLRGRLLKADRPSFLSDKAQLDHLAGLWKNKRVRCVRGDLTASGALRAFGDVARRAGWVVRALYMSNAELYFPYDQGSFRDNIRSLPYDDRSVILHTHPASPIEYYYIWQEAQGYAKWTERVHKFVELLHDAKMPRQGKLENGAWLIKPPAGSP